MERIHVPEDWRNYNHALYPEMRLGLVGPCDVTPEESDLPRVCRTAYGEPICQCGRYILEWTPPRSVGRSQGSDGANR